MKRFIIFILMVFCAAPAAPGCRKANPSSGGEAAPRVEQKQQAPKPAPPEQTPAPAPAAAAPQPERNPMVYVVNMNLSPGVMGSPRRIAAAVEAVSDYDTVIEHYSQVSPQRVAELNPCAVIFSGQGDPWDKYPEDSLKGVRAFALAPDRPLLGICGGHQFIALTYGARIDRIKRLEPGDGYKGCLKQEGYAKITPVANDPVFDNQQQPLTLYEAHYDEVKNVPDGFDLIATNGMSPVQAIKHKTLPLYGFQFHPEIWEPEHAQGRGVLARFLKLCENKPQSTE